MNRNRITEEDKTLRSTTIVILAGWVIFVGVVVWHATR